MTKKQLKEQNKKLQGTIDTLRTRLDIAQERNSYLVKSYDQLLSLAKKQNEEWLNFYIKGGNKL